MLEFYEAQRRRVLENPGVSPDSLMENDPTRIAWGALMRDDTRRGRQLKFDRRHARVGASKPFSKQWFYFHRDANHSGYKLGSLMPSATTPNHGICLTSAGSHDPFSAVMIDVLPNHHTLDTCAILCRWKFAKADSGDSLPFESTGGADVVDGFRRLDNVTDLALRRFAHAYGEHISRDDVFFYVYGLLHSPDYRETYAADLKKMLPRIPLVEDAKPFIDAGRKLSEIHLGYEAATPYPLDGLDVAGPGGDAAYEFFRVEKMRFGKPTAVQKAAGENKDRSTIVYNDRITLSGVPEGAYRYMLGSRSAVEWIIDRYQVRTDKDSGIVNDPNDWSREVGDPRYIIDLLARIVTVSLETMKIVDHLPPLAIRADQGSTT
jgi:predicted helicase